MQALRGLFVIMIGLMAFGAARELIIGEQSGQAALLFVGCVGFLLVVFREYIPTERFTQAF